MCSRFIPSDLTRQAFQAVLMIFSFFAELSDAVFSDTDIVVSAPQSGNDASAVKASSNWTIWDMISSTGWALRVKRREGGGVQRRRNYFRAPWFGVEMLWMVGCFVLFMLLFPFSRSGLWDSRKHRISSTLHTCTRLQQTANCYIQIPPVADSQAAEAFTLHDIYSPRLFHWFHETFHPADHYIACWNKNRKLYRVSNSNHTPKLFPRK